MLRVGRNTLLMSVMILASSNSLPSAEAADQPVVEVAKTRADVDKLLTQARQAMKAGKLPEAESLVRQAESAKLRYPVLNFGDTPAKVRRDLQKIQGKLQGKQGTTSGKPKSILGLRYPASSSVASTQDPFNSKTAKTAGGKPSVVNSLRLPKLATLEQPASLAPKQVSTPAANKYPIQQAVAEQFLDSTPKQQVQQIKQAAASAAVPIDLTMPYPNPADQAALKLAQATAPSAEKLTQLPVAEELLPQPENAMQLLRGGENALRSGDRNQALKMFRSAHQRRNELDVLSQQQLQDHLQMLSGGSIAATPRKGKGSLLSSASAGQAVLARQLSADIGKRQAEAARLRKSDPQGALKMLQEANEMVAKSDLDDGMKTQLTRRVNLSVAETERFIRDNGADIELERANHAVLEDIDRRREVKQQVREKLAKLVDEYNTLRDEQRYAQMEIVAKRAYDMAPNEPVAQQLWENAKFIRRSVLNREIDHLTESGVDKTFRDIRRSAADGLAGINTPYSFGDAKTFGDMIKNRKGATPASRQTARELEIKRKLRTPVLPRYDNMALAEVVESLSELTDVNIHLDPRGLGQEGVRTDTPVSLSLGQEISLESALSLILEPLHLTYMIKDEVLKITSEQIRDGDTYQHVYNVADLVIPIPNFVPTSNMGLQGLINDGYNALPNVRNAGDGPIAYVPGGQAGLNNGLPGNPNVLQQQQQFGGGSIGSGNRPMTGGPGGLGGAAAADFDSLIELITSTVEHESWMENGTGDGEIQEFATNLSLVISQTQRVHEQIADLLAQLRRLQDLQVTIEVRYIDLTDNFFERIGIDFDFNIEDGSGIDNADLNNVGATFEPKRRSSTVGITASSLGITDPLPDFTLDLDVPFRNNAFGLAVPQFGGHQSVGEFGFAILSDIEAFFLINASQGDVRANVLQAPKVTLFNGQQAMVVDAAFTPFVISVIPVVGEFAAAQQPVIVVLSEGTMMTVQAVVSDDRRYVRLTLVPFFSQIGEVKTFTFEGSETTTTSSNTTDDDDDGNNESDDNTNNVVRSGTTVQLPTFEVISIATTVSVPDGGTVLLGGIKRLEEGRNEFGVPLLSKIPYIDRLFRNVGIGRSTRSLMMMVTPHIIIQEEEEERLGIAAE